MRDGDIICTRRRGSANLRTPVRQPEIDKHVSSHVFRHRLARNLLRKGTDICIIQELLGHADIKTTRIYLHSLNREDVKVVMCRRWRGHFHRPKLAFRTAGKPPWGNRWPRGWGIRRDREQQQWWMLSRLESGGDGGATRPVKKGRSARRSWWDVCCRRADRRSERSEMVTSCEERWKRERRDCKLQSENCKMKSGEEENGRGTRDAAVGFGRYLGELLQAGASRCGVPARVAASEGKRLKSRCRSCAA
ncbi:MAG: tyrosine-type recombinase/integrase [Novipirellula sp. JB048]